MSNRAWDFWIDRGGTFTDIVARRPDGTLATHKLLSENPEQYEDAALAGIRALLGLAPQEPLPADRVSQVKMGTTVATNALLERKGEPLLFLTTQGLADVLSIGTQNRPHIFKLAIEKPGMLYAEVAEVPERVTAEGEVLMPLDEAATRTALQAAREKGLDAVAIAFLHGYRHTAHEARAAEIAREMGFAQVSVSHEVSPLVKLVARGDTTVVDAYLSPILKRYVDRVAGDIGATEGGNEAPRLYFMQSSGALAEARHFSGKDAILSGPAGGVVGAVETSKLAGFDRIIGFDMGGTSTDVCHYAGALERTFDAQVAGARLRAPMMQIHTVAAGGGSILHFDGQRMRAGPHSAGANPGPACYRRGGPLTVTDANLALGRLVPAHFPAVFGPGADEPLDAGAVREKFETLAAEVGKSVEATAEGFLRIAVENMAQAIKKISVQRGHDVSTYTLCCFGGAGGQHACSVADALGMTRVFLHPFAGILSAYGMGLARIGRIRDRAVEAELTEDSLDDVRGTIAELDTDNRTELEAQGLGPDRLETDARLLIRYQGTDTALQVPMGELSDIRQAFEDSHSGAFGFSAPDKPLVIEAVSVETAGADADVADEDRAAPADAPLPDPLERRAVWCDGGWREAEIHARETLSPGHEVAGPALLIEPHSTIVVEPGWQASVTEHDHLVLERTEARPKAYAIGTEADPVMLEIFNNLFMAIAEQMGVTLENTAHSVNIKERLDFSCAVFDGAGGLVANAPHMPVHLGSMGASVRTVIDGNPEMKPGDVFALNAPYNGGTHLPDVTVIAPVFDAAGETLLFFTAARGHHADIGGISPGSMPANSRTVEEEGVLIDNFRLVSGGRFEEEAVRALFSGGHYPARNPDQNLADLKAQVAACTKGAQELRRMVETFGLDVVNAYMGHVQANAEESVRRVIDVLSDGAFVHRLDDGSEIHVAVTVDRQSRSVTIDFSGTSPAVPTNLNAPSAVTRAAALYVFRCLVDDDIPLNEGCLAPLKLIIPKGSLLDPAYPAAVVGGNVETSQAVTDALFAALGASAAAQGTMNNLTFGNERTQYYETICGGAGAGPTFDGADAVHTHMTNSRLTDPEVLEMRFPVLVSEFGVRRGSGGAGAHPGGDGARRQLTFREPVTVSLLSTRRTTRPFGLNGGGDALPGHNVVIHADGRREEVPGSAELALGAGDSILVETPGGGGFGKPD